MPSHWHGHLLAYSTLCTWRLGRQCLPWLGHSFLLLPTLAAEECWARWLTAASAPTGTVTKAADTFAHNPGYFWCRATVQPYTYLMAWHKAVCHPNPQTHTTVQEPGSKRQGGSSTWGELLWDFLEVGAESNVIKAVTTDSHLNAECRKSLAKVFFWLLL